MSSYYLSPHHLDVPDPPAAASVDEGVKLLAAVILLRGRREERGRRIDFTLKNRVNGTDENR